MKLRAWLDRLGMLGVLALLGVVFSVMTIADQAPTGSHAGKQLASVMLAENPAPTVLIVGEPTADDQALAGALESALTGHGRSLVVLGQPRDARRQLVKLKMEGTTLDFIAGSANSASWLLFSSLGEDFPEFTATKLISPKPYRWPNFLKAGNLLNIASQISVIAIVGIGMTLVIMTGGIDLSVGSMIALSAVVTCQLLQERAGGVQATNGAIVLCAAAGILACGLFGLCNGLLIAKAGLPPFIATLATMQIISGLAYRSTKGETMHLIPDRFVWLGRASDLSGLPNSVLLVVIFYVIAQAVMAWTVYGRQVLAVGGNAEAARLSGVPTQRIVISVYVLAGLLAGLGGVMMASQLKSGSPTYGQSYELYTIAAVVVGGASLTGGEGRVFDTLIGALVIAVIRNGMNLANIEAYTQNIVLGVLILTAVMLDQWKRRAALSA